MVTIEPLATHQSVAGAYLRAVESGYVENDPAQLTVARKLDRLLSDILAVQRASKSSALGWLFAKNAPKRESVRGLYIHGAVGRGKTMLMDMFHDLLPVKPKRRAHFNDFMADIHDRIAAKRAEFKKSKAKNTDPIPPVAADIANESRVLCFDEFSVTDIADAMILSRLFSALFLRGVVLVATSNVAPSNLYEDGLNRDLFMPFINLLATHTEALSLDARTDYRMEKLTRLPVYVTPLGPQADEQIQMAWFTATEGAPSRCDTIELKGRRIEIPAAAAGFARFTFEELCGRPLGARDYLALAHKYRGFFIEDIPVMDLSRRNEAKRFILLIDTLYDAGARLVVSAATPPEGLYAGKTGTETFEFARTISRLIEMQSADWALDADRQISQK
jgi:cell division protein ZapE